MRAWLIAMAAGAAAAGCAPMAGQGPEAPEAVAGAPGVSRMQVGQARVTTVLDGRFQFPMSLFQGVEGAEAARLLQAGGEAIAGPEGPQWHATVQGFLVDAGGRQVLVDTGAGATMPGAGNLPDNLRAAGVAPDAVDAVLISHFHADHIGGLVDEEGRARFPNATLHAHADEVAFWTNLANAASAPAAMKDFFAAAQRVSGAYGARLRTFRSGEVTPGITAEPAVGHTPGHTVFRLSSGGRDIFFIGDMIHARSLQLPRPEVSLAFDLDATQARAARAGFLARVAGTNALVAGPHFPFPGVGRIRREGQGYGFTPAGS